MTEPKKQHIRIDFDNGSIFTLEGERALVNLADGFKLDMRFNIRPSPDKPELYEFVADLLGLFDELEDAGLVVDTMYRQEDGSWETTNIDGAAMSFLNGLVDDE